VIERIYRTRVKDLWWLWTTKEGFESWWGGEGSRVEVHTIEAREGGTLHYDMIAVEPADATARHQLGLARSSSVRAKFTQFIPYQRLTLTHVIDCVPGVKTYESTIAVEFFPAGDFVRMVTTIEPMHNAEFTKTSIRVFTSQLKMLEEQFQSQ
jgi:uncharacterized protein YndB with AHSA1/START domain